MVLAYYELRDTCYLMLHLIVTPFGVFLFSRGLLLGTILVYHCDSQKSRDGALFVLFFVSSLFF